MSKEGGPQNPKRRDPLTQEATALQRAIAALEKMKARLDSVESASSEPIAIIGMACRFPGEGEGPDAFWNVLDQGIDAVREIPESRWPASVISGEPQDTRWAALLDDLSTFDAAFFGISPREAETLDPQQRMLLEMTWEALENAGVRPEKLIGSRTGVFIGISNNDYQLLVNDARSSQYDAYCGTGNLFSTAAGRISFVFGFQGPAVSMDTACSSSLVAISQGCQSLRAGDADLVVTGGVNAILSWHTMALLHATQALSADGRCKTFDARANGYARGEGCGIIVLKRLSDALRDGDNIRGLIRGWAINQDGRSSGLTAPNVLSQQTMLRQALVRAKLTPTDIDYVEVHGTGTSLGDPIEVDALREVLGGPRADGSKCVLGAVKTNIGHLESAAGVAGIIKILLCLEHGAIPKNLHFRRLNPRISLDGTPLVIPTETIPWPRGNKPRRAGVSAFGMSGTNAHIILEEALPDKPHESIPEYAAYLLPLSAKNLQALRALAKSYTKWFAAEHDVPLYDVMYTATERRTHHEYRLAVAANSPKEFADLLEQFALGQTPARVVYGQASSQETPRVVFVFSGQGSQWAEMGKTLLEEEPVFRAQVEEIDALVRHHARFSVVDELCAPVGRSRLDETEVVQPTLFALQVGLVALLDSWGIAPDAVIGHSVGEVAAAYASGALALEDAVRLVVWRGRIMQQATGLGKMVWVALPEAEASLTITGLEDKLAIAAVNDPNSVVLSGETNAVEVVVADLEKRGIATRALRVNYAFHSPQMAPLARDLVTRLGRSTAKPTKITMYSTLTGKRIEGNALVAEYWGLNVLSTVNLASAVHSALQDETNIFIEVGPHPVLVASIEQCTANQKRDIHVISVLRRQFGGRRAALEVIASLHTRGFDVDWKKFLPIDGRVVPLPTYSWQRQRYWLETSESSPKKTASDPINELFYAVQWRQKGHAAERATKTGGNGKYFIFGHGPRAETFIQLLESQKRSCILVRSGSRFARLTPTSFTIDLDNPVHYDDVFREGLRQDERCAGIIYLFPADQLTIHELTEDSVNGALTWNFFAVISLIRTLSAQKWRSRPPLWLVTRGAVTVAEEPISSPIHTALWSLGRTIDLENPEIDCRRVDLAPNVAEDDAARSLFLEIDTGDGENQVAIRNGERFVARIGQTRLPPRSEMQFTLRGDATYLITGGLGGLGLTIAQWMAGVGARNIALVGRREPSADARTRIQQIEATYGARVLVFQANVAQRSSIAAVFADLAISAPPIVGIVHAAGVATESMPLAETRRDAFAKVMASKAIGALHLHTLSLPLALEFFVLYSSASAVLGLVGQASYSAANAFLDAMAAWRASHGLPAMSIQWGAFATVGMVADKEIQNRITSGMTALTADDGTMVLSRLLEHPRPHISVMKFVPRQWLDLFPQLAAIPYFADLMQAPHTSATVRSSTNDQRFREKLAATKESERMTLLEEHVRRTLSQILKLPENEIGKRSPFQTLGVDSLMSLELRNRLESSIGVKLPATLLFTYVHLEALTTFLLAECDLTTDSAMEPVAATSVVIAAEENEPIAIIGQACRFPGGGTNPERFWQSLIEGVDAIREVMPTRWPRGTIPEGNPGASYAALLDDIDQFDAAFFGISPREAEALDPQQRMLLEVTWEALENAGVPAERLSGSKTGVYVGITGLDYQHLVLDHPEHLDAYGATGTMLATAAGRLSYVFGLQGPAIALDTACSSSLVTVHLACQSLRNGGISLAIAGGANALLAWQTMVMLSSMRALSIDGRCKTLDARANGYVRGEGCGIVVLKRLADALRDGDRILGLIRGSATNQDGRSTGLTTPNVLAQKDLLLQALDNAHLTSEDIGYLELHGTGTPLGDPIEADALRAVFGKTRSDASNLYLGALKTNIGHLESAAGVASVIKVLSVLQHERIPANLHFHALNPRISFDGMPFVIPTASTIWPRNDKPRRAGVSAFGMSGTNAHIILEEAPHQPATLSSESTGYLLPISAKTPTALQKLAQSYSHWLADHQDVSLYDLAYTASLRRTHHEHRLTTVAKTSKEFSDLLGAFARGEAPSGISYNHISAQHEPQIVFVFSGQGSQWAGMGKTLLDAEPVFNDKLIEIDALVGKYATFSIVAELRSPEESSRLDATEIVQPTLFALQVALVELLRSWGVTPAAVIGHSIGEVTAAHVSGALTLEDAVRLVILRGQIMQRATGHGKMVWAGMPVAEAEYAITEFADKLSIAAINDPASVVLSGETAFLDTLVATLNKRGLVTRPLRVNYAFHSPQMNTLAEELTTRLQRLDTQTNSITLYSTVTGTPIDGNALGPEYWGRNVRATVNFAAAVSAALDAGHQDFLEIGPHPVLMANLEQSAASKNIAARIVPTLRKHRDDHCSLLETLGALHTAGVEIAWERLFLHRGRVISLPTYTWEHERYWIDTPHRKTFASHSNAFATPEPAGHPLLGMDIAVSAIRGVYVFQRTLSSESPNYLRDHRVGDETVFPGTGYLEMALAASGQLEHVGTIALENIEIEQRLVLDADGALLQLVLERNGPDTAKFRIASRDGKIGQWLRHATGCVRYQTAVRPESFEHPEKLATRYSATRTSDEHYLRMEQAGLAYGPSFRGAEELWVGEGRALARIVLPESVTDEAAHIIHPALLDACFQAVDAAATGIVEGTYLPVGVQRLVVWEKPQRTMWVVIQFRALDPKDPDIASVDLHLIHEDGRVVVEVAGLRVKRMAKQAGTDPLDTLVHVTNWRVKPVDVEANASHTGTWLVLSDPDEFGDSATRLLRDTGARCVRVFIGQQFVRRCADEFEINPNHPEDYRTLLHEAFPGHAVCRGVIHSWSLHTTPSESATSESLSKDLLRGCIGALHLVQALVRFGWRDAPPLFLLTRSAQAVRKEERIQVAQAPLWGLGRTITLEHPALACKCVDLGHSSDGDETTQLLRELVASDREDQIALRGKERFVARLVRSGFDTPGKTTTMLREPAHGRPYRLWQPDPGILERVHLRTLTRRSPGKGEVEIEVVASALNFIDVLMAMGIYPGMPKGGTPLGSDFSGRIVAIGEGVTDFMVGQEVIGSAHGAFATHVTTNALLVVAKPAHLTFEEAAAIPSVFMTVHYALQHVGRARQGEKILIHSATGGTGLAAIQMSRLLGLEIFATAGNDEKRDHLRRLGITHVMDSRSLRFADQIMDATNGAGVDMVLNSLTGDAILKGFEILAPYGRFLELGKRDIYENERIGLFPFRKSLSYAAIDLAGMSIDKPLLFASLLREVATQFNAKKLHPLPIRIFSVVQADDAFRLMAQARHIGKIVVSMKDPAAEIVREETRVATAIRNDASYLITGGLGELGQVAAKWLVERGARHVGLLGRNAPSKNASESIAAMRAAGANVHVFQADVAQLGDLERATVELEKHAPIRGIIHAAGVLADRSLLELTAEQFHRVMQPKMLGAWNLHMITRRMPLDFFVLYSSSAGLLGAPGQGNYAAANVFLDGLAQYRRASGLAGMSIQWGPFSEVGMAAAKEFRGGRAAARGVDSLTPDEGIHLLERLLAEPKSNMGIMRLDTRRFQEFYPHIITRPFWSDMRPAVGQTPTALGGSRILSALQQTPTAKRLDILKNYLVEQLGRVLRLSQDRIGHTTPFQSLGVDSLMSLEMRNRVEVDLQIKLSSTLLFTYPDIASLAENIVQRIALPTQPDEPPPVEEAEEFDLIAAVELAAPETNDDNFLAEFDASIAELMDLEDG